MGPPSLTIPILQGILDWYGSSIEVKIVTLDWLSFIIGVGSKDWSLKMLMRTMAMRLCLEVIISSTLSRRPVEDASVPSVKLWVETKPDVSPKA